MITTRFPVVVDRSRNNSLTEFGKQTLTDRYLLKTETDYQDVFVRVACAYATDAEHAQRLYDYMSKLWFMPATPVLANGGTDRGLPISCFLNTVEDSLDSIVGTWNENVWLASGGGGIGTYWGRVRAVGEDVGERGESSGIMPFLKVMDSQTLAISQGSLRRGSAAVYLRVDHPEIEEFVEMRRPTGGDPNRRSLNLHHGVVISDEFMIAVKHNLEWALLSPKTHKVVKTVSARDLWIRILTARIETGEPYLYFSDTVNRLRPPSYKKNNLYVETSNLCNEMTLFTGKDYNGKTRTAVCCLSSLNIEKYDEWVSDTRFIVDVMEFLDNVLEDFIHRAPPQIGNAIYSATQERSVGLGVMGFHSYLQSKGIPFESVSALSLNKSIFRNIYEKVEIADSVLCEKRGPCEDARRVGLNKRFSNKTAVAPTASISIICGGTSPCIEPWMANVFSQKTLSGTFTVRNKYLQKTLAAHGKDNPDVWASIIRNSGSVSHLDFLTEWEQLTFRTAIEIDQKYIVKMAGDRQKYLDQSQSVNLFLPANASKKEIHDLHFSAWEQGLKGLYYCRSLSIQRAEAVSQKIAQKNEKDGEVCEVCQ